MRSHTVVCAKSEFRESLFKGLRIPGADELFCRPLFLVVFYAICKRNDRRFLSGGKPYILVTISVIVLTTDFCGDIMSA